MANERAPRSERLKEEREKRKIIICLVIKRDENFFLILFSEGYLGFNPGMFTAPSERPVLSRQAEIVFEPQRGDLNKLQFQNRIGHPYGTVSYLCVSAKNK